jgi:phage terminase large subunit
LRKKLTHEAIKACEQYAQSISGDRHSSTFGIVSPDGELLKIIERVDGEWTETDKPPLFYIAEKLERVLSTKKRFVVVIGGRGSGKSVGVGDIMLAGIMDDGDKVYFLREYQESISESVHALLKEEISRVKLNDFTIQQAAIYHAGGGEAKYRGLARSPESIKSAHGFKRFEVEEAQFISADSLKNLTPTARNTARYGLPGALAEEEVDELSGVQMFFVGNPRSSADPFSQRFINPYLPDILKNGYYEDDLHLIVQMNYTDNPWFGLSGLDKERLFDFEHKSRAEYDHVWKGAFLDDVENSIIIGEWFDACVDAHIKLGFEPLGQEKISYDPADSGDAKAIAYMHGAVLLDVRSTKHGLIDTATDWALTHVQNIKPDVFTWDVNGIGGGLKRQITDALGKKKIHLSAFNSSYGPDNPDEIYDAVEGEVEGSKTNANMFANMRAQCYWKLRDRMIRTYLAVIHKKHFIPDNMISFSSNIKELEAFRSELCRIPRKYVSSGRIQIMSKEEMRSKKIKSPNMADAVMMLQRNVDVDDPQDDYDDEPQTANSRWA